MILHPSTALALSALEWLQERNDFETVLDMGCGNGILAITASRVWDAHVLACDISDAAVSDAKENVVRAGCDSHVSVIKSDGFKHHKIPENAPYDLIIANLLAEWQVSMARDIQKNLTPGGYVILSGILAWLSSPVKDAFSSAKCNIIHELSDKEWYCYILCHKAEAVS
jgi:ribosomal protein L11 methyltransferase